MRVKNARDSLLVAVLLAITLVGCSGKPAVAQDHATGASATVATRANTLYLIANGHLMALDARTRAVRWTDSQDEFFAYSAPVYDSGVVYAANNALSAFNAANGA